MNGGRATTLFAADQYRNIRRPHVCFVFFGIVSTFVFWKPLRALIDFTVTHDYASHIVLVIPISAYILYRNRQEIFQDIRSNVCGGLSLLFVATGLLWIRQRYFSELASDEQLSLVTLAIIFLWIAGFVSTYGTRAFARARFPLLFLLLLIPIPEIFITRLTILLQSGSATVAYVLLRLLHVPVFRRGFMLSVPSLDIEVAEECSGIRSSFLLMLTTVLVGQFALRSFWRKSLLILAVIPILVLKNGVRIVTISLLTIYVDRRFLHGWLHTSGGVVFYFLGILALIPIAILLGKGDKGAENYSPKPPHSPADRICSPSSATAV